MVTQSMKTERESLLPALSIAFAAIMWGTIGIFGKVMMNSGLSAYMTGCIKLLGSSLMLGLYFVNGKRSYFKIGWRDLGALLVMAFFTQAIFNCTYYPVVDMLGVAQAGVLLYTAPIFLTIWSTLLFKEALTARKVFGVCLCFTGSVLAITGGSMAASSFSTKGIILGLMSAVSFSLMSVFSKFLLKRLKPLTVIFYAFLFGGLMIMPFANMSAALPILMQTPVLMSALGLALIGSVLPYIFYFKGIHMGIDLSKAGVISVIELITSICLAIVLFGEYLTLVKTLGVALIIIAIIIIQKPQKMLC